jgi:hypothetical protein
VGLRGSGNDYWGLEVEPIMLAQVIMASVTAGSLLMRKWRRSEIW